jgi:membrane associated rhomboid family serine protease
MLIPWGTDAPIYHRPFATIGVIAINTIVWTIFPMGPDHDSSWALVLGDGIHPLQWLSNIFLHQGIGHLLGNMLFLWAFGIIVEGKLGWRGFLFVYLGLGLAESAIFQLVIQPQESIRMIGASGVIFGLLAMCLVWAPRNELQCIVIFRVLPIDFDLPILGFAAFYIGMEVFFLSFKGMAVSSELAHCTGAVLGFAVGVVLLKQGLVDCENWDLFAVLQGRQGESEREFKKRKASRSIVSSQFQSSPRAGRERFAKKGGGKKSRGKGDAEVDSVEDLSAARLRAMRHQLELGEVEAALATYKKPIRSMPDWHPPEPDWVDLINAILKSGRWEDAMGVMRDYHRAVREPSPKVLLKLSQILIDKMHRPLQAKRILAEIPESSLPDKLETIRLQLIHKADHLAQDEDGPLELQDEMW